MNDTYVEADNFILLSDKNQQNSMLISDGLELTDSNNITKHHTL